MRRTSAPLQTPARYTQAESGNYLLSVAHALTAYAKTDEAFDMWLRAHIDLADTQVAPRVDSPKPTPAPLRPSYTTRKAWWLFDQIRLNHEESELAADHLFTFARIREREDPKAIVLGITVGVLPIGVFGEMKRKTPMNIVFPHKTTMREDRSLVAEASHRVLEQGLIRAKGNTHLLEPELSDWFFGDKAFCYWQGPRKALALLQNELTTIGSPYAAIENERGVRAIALSPAIELDTLVSANLLTKID